MEEGDVNNGGDEAGKTECISHGENSAEIQMAFLLICLHRDLDEILGPPHGSGVHQEPAENPGPSKPQNLRGHHDGQRNPKSQRPAVENLDGGDDVDGVRIGGAAVGEDGDQHVLLHVKRGTTAIWAEIELMVNGSRRYQKNWLRKERRKQASAPRSHVRNVTAGKVGSSVTGTVRATCSTGEFSPSAGELDGDSSLL
nr:predicted protein [Ipomoea batatas]